MRCMYDDTCIDDDTGTYSYNVQYTMTDASTETQKHIHTTYMYIIMYTLLAGSQVGHPACRNLSQVFSSTATHNCFTTLFSRTTWVSRYQEKSSSGRYGAREDNRGRHTDHLAGRHSIGTNQWPTSIMPQFLRRMLFMPQPSHFILAWDRHQICWLAYPVAWFSLLEQMEENQGRTG